MLGLPWACALLHRDPNYAPAPMDTQLPGSHTVFAQRADRVLGSARQAVQPHAIGLQRKHGVRPRRVGGHRRRCAVEVAWSSEHAQYSPSMSARIALIVQRILVTLCSSTMSCLHAVWCKFVNLCAMLTCSYHPCFIFSYVHGRAPRSARIRSPKACMIYSVKLGAHDKHRVGEHPGQGPLAGAAGPSARGGAQPARVSGKGADTATSHSASGPAAACATSERVLEPCERNAATQAVARGCALLRKAATQAGASAQGGAQPARAGLTWSAAQGSAERSITAEAPATEVSARVHLVRNKRTTYVRQPWHSCKPKASGAVYAAHLKQGLYKA
jgi:hypothetical protein